MISMPSAAGHQLDGNHPCGIPGDLRRLARGDRGHRHMVLLAGGGRDRIDACREGQALVLADQGSGGHLGIIRPDPRRNPRSGRRANRSSSDRPGRDRRSDRAHLANAIESCRRRKQPAGRGNCRRRWLHLHPGRRSDSRSRRRLDGQRPRGILEQVERGPHHLRLAAEAVRVLHPAAGDVAVRISLPLSNSAMAAATRICPGWPRSAERAGRRLGAAPERVDRQGARGERRGEHPLAVEQRIERERGAGLGAVDEGEAFLGAKRERLMPSFRARPRQASPHRRRRSGRAPSAPRSNGRAGRDRRSADAALARDSGMASWSSNAWSASMTSGLTPE